GRGGEPGRRPDRGDQREHGVRVGPGRRGNPRRARRGLGGARNEPHFRRVLRRVHRVRRDHRGAARKIPAVGNGVGGVALRSAPRGGAVHADHGEDPDRHRARHPSRDRAVHRRTGIGPDNIRSTEDGVHAREGGGGMSAPALDVDEEVESTKTKLAIRTPIILAPIAVVGLILFGPGGESTFVLSDTRRDTFQLPNLTVPSKGAALLLMAVALLLALAAFWIALNRRKLPKWVVIGYGLAVVLAMLVWVIAGNDYGLAVPFLLATTVTASLPLCFGALAGVLCERSGTINIAIEGQLLAGAFMTAIIGAATGNFYIGLIAAPIAGALVSVLLAVFTIKYRVDQIIVGVVLNVLVLGLTNYLFSTVLTQNQSLRTPPPVGAWRIPLLADIPVIGQALFNQNVIVYTMIVGVFALQFM